MPDRAEKCAVASAPGAPEILPLAALETPAAPLLSSLHHDDAVLAKRLALAFFALAALTYCLIVLGALVRAHGAGLACPDWPLCFGEVIPEFDFKVAFEWGHRALAGTVGLLFAGLAFATLRRPSLRSKMALGLLVAAILLAIQIVLGGLTVLELLAYWTVTSHLVTGNAFALALVLLGRRLHRISGAADRRERPSEQHRDGARLRPLVSFAGAVLAIQIVLGGLVSSNYAGLACPDWPTCMNGEYFPTFSGIQGLHLFHRLTGFGAALVIAVAAWSSRHDPVLRRWLGIAALVVVVQVLVGIANVLLRVPVEVTGLHSALAAALICTVGVSVAEVWRPSR